MRKYLQGSDPLVHECVQPFQSLAYPLEPEELLEIARFHARKAAVHIRGIVGHKFSKVPYIVTCIYDIYSGTDFSECVSGDPSPRSPSRALC
jgi:hypothetical protein